MKKIRLLDLENVNPLRSQIVYHAAAYAMKPESPDTILLVSPSTPYVCIGFHQDMEKEVDLEYCKNNNLDIYRREVGGGAVYLDNGQIFTQWIFQRNSLPQIIEKQFELYVKPLVETYKTIGINAYFRPINDIHVENKKIGGTGAAQIGNASVIVGSLMMNFDKQTMSKVLKVPSEKMRDKIFESLENYMTTIAEQLKNPPAREEVKNIYIKKCEEFLNAEIIPGTWTDEEEEMALKLEKEYTTEDWLFQKGSIKKTGVKIHEDVNIYEKSFKAPGGLVRATIRVNNNLIDDIEFSGDFTLQPSGSLKDLENSLKGTKMDELNINSVLEDLYSKANIQSPGLTSKDFAKVILS